MSYDSVAMLIKMINAQVDKLTDSLLDSYEMTGVQFKILKYLYSNSCKLTRMVDLESYFDMESHVAANAIKALENKDYIARIVDSNDKRSKIIVLTDHAWEMKEEIFDIGRFVEAQITQRLTDDERKQLSSLIQKCMAS